MENLINVAKSREKFFVTGNVGVFEKHDCQEEKVARKRGTFNLVSFSQKYYKVLARHKNKKNKGTVSKKLNEQEERKGTQCARKLGKRGEGKDTRETRNSASKCIGIMGHEIC